MTDPEPAAEDSPFRKLPNVVLTSHIAGMPHPWIGRWAVSAIESYLQGETPAGQVTVKMLEHIA